MRVHRTSGTDTHRQRREPAVSGLGIGVNVTLTAGLSPNRSGVLYAWHFEGNGALDTVPDANPTVTTLYPDKMVKTATVAVIKNGRTKLSDSITFHTLRCQIPAAFRQRRAQD
jgi:hypothetical protein